MRGRRRKRHAACGLRVLRRAPLRLARWAARARIPVCGCERVGRRWLPLQGWHAHRLEKGLRRWVRAQTSVGRCCGCCSCMCENCRHLSAGCVCCCSHAVVACFHLSFGSFRRSHRRREGCFIGADSSIQRQHHRFASRKLLRAAAVIRRMSLITARWGGRQQVGRIGGWHRQLRRRCGCGGGCRLVRQHWIQMCRRLRRFLFLSLLSLLPAAGRRLHREKSSAREERRAKRVEQCACRAADVVDAEAKDGTSSHWHVERDTGTREVDSEWPL